MKAFLKGNQFEIDEAENGALAVNKFTSRKYDIVLMDMYMPVVDGYEATAAIRKWERENKAARTPIIALTAAAMSGDMERSLDAGCDFHVTKPVSKSVLAQPDRVATEGRADEASASKPYDVAAELGDPELFAEVAQLFLDEMDRLMVAIDAAFADSDFKKLKDYVHSLKGSAAMVGANPMATICKEIEAAIASASRDGVRRRSREASFGAAARSRGLRQEARCNRAGVMKSRRNKKQSCSHFAIEGKDWRGINGDSNRHQNINRRRFHADPQDVARAPGDPGLHHRGRGRESESGT